MPRIDALLGLGSAAALVVTAALTAPQQSGQAPPPPDPAAQAIEKLDKAYQSLFADLEATEDQVVEVLRPDGRKDRVLLQGRVGLSRVETGLKGHGYLGEKDKDARRLLSEVRSGWHVDVRCFHLSGRRLDAAELQGELLVWPANLKQSQSLPSEQILPFVRREFKAILGGRVHKNLNGWRVEARAVRLSQKGCLSCHGWGKVGDPVAVMVYSVRRREAN
jgi:hypothetical protein